jgi:hypothetical protein
MFDYHRIGDEIWDRFNAEKEDALWYYETLSKAFAEAWPRNPLLPDLKAIVERMEAALMGPNN